ncbi:MAG: GlxA family transcriptional regulator [Pseudomonadota bacterium]
MTPVSNAIHPNSTFGFLLLEAYPMLPVSGMIDVLRDAAYVTERAQFRWFTISAVDSEVMAMNGMRTLTEYTTENAPMPDVLVVCAGLGGHLIDDQRVVRYLRAANRGDTQIGAIATGSWLLARAGLLQGRRCTVHWEDIPSFEETFPMLNVSRSLYVRDGKFFTCSGGTSAIDLFLEFVSESIGEDVSSDVARQIMHQAIRAGSQGVPLKHSPFRPVASTLVEAATKLMHEHIESPLAIGAIARHVKVNVKTLERQFLSHFRTTPQLHYRTIRLEHARALLRLTDVPIWSVALQTGFGSPQYLSQCYRAQFGHPPSTEREQLRRSSSEDNQGVE